MAITYDRQQPIRGTAASWTSSNTVLLAGEVGYETDTGKTKLGDGSTAWNVLPYVPRMVDLSTTTGGTGGAVASVAGRTGAVTLTKTDVGLGNVDNVADVNKPVSAAQQAALNTKAPTASPTFTGTVTGVTKAMVGLGNIPTPSAAGDSTTYLRGDGVWATPSGGSGAVTVTDNGNGTFTVNGTGVVDNGNGTFTVTG